MRRHRHILCLLCAGLLALCFSVRAHSQAPQIASIEIVGLTGISAEEVKGIMGLAEGDPYSPEALAKAERNLRAWGAFETIRFRTSSTAAGVVLRLHLTEATVVIAIDVAGNYPYIENKVLKHLTLHPGDVASREQIDEQIERIKTFYAREGYVGTDVTVDEELLPEKGGVVLTFHIHRGIALRLRTVEVEGNTVWPDGRFVAMLIPWRQFSERRFSQSLRSIRDLYRLHGYPKARLRVLEKNIDLPAKRVDLRLEVAEGPHVELAFRGAHRANHKLLKKTVTVLREGSFDRYEIEQSVEALQEFYRNRGYPNASIRAEKTERPDGTIVIAFDIDEGKASRIKWLSFEGNREVKGSELKAGMRNQEPSFERPGVFLPESTPEDNDAVLLALRRHGYLSATVGEWKIKPSPQGFALDIKIPIAEGPQTKVGEVSFSGKSDWDAVRLLRELKIRPGKPFDEPGLEDDRQRLLNFYADNGYPYADIQQSWEPGTDGQAIIRYQIAEGQLVRIGRILIIGDVLTSQKAIKHAMNIREGDRFSARKLFESQLAIRRLGPFAAVSVETIGIETREPIVHIKVNVEEERPFQLDLGIAYSSYEGFTGSLSFTNLNAFGWAKSNALKLVGGRRLSRAEILWFDPRFLSSSFEMATNAWIQYMKRPAYAYSQVGGAMGWFRRLRRFGLTFRWELDRNYFIAGDSVAANADSLRNNTISRTSCSASYDSRDSFSDPRRGFYTLGGVDLYNEIRGAEANFVKFQWQGENDLSAFNRFTLATSLRFNNILTIGRNVSVPSNELLYLGGDDTIRGFPEDSLGPQNAGGQAVGGLVRWIWNEELRIRLWRSLQWAFFSDMGSLTNGFTAIDWTTIRNSMGFGLRYLTPVGPIRLDYGFKLDRRAGEPLGRFHFTFGYVF